jgi:hypothetical protein
MLSMYRSFLLAACLATCALQGFSQDLYIPRDVSLA